MFLGQPVYSVIKYKFYVNQFILFVAGISAFLSALLRWLFDCLSKRTLTLKTGYGKMNTVGRTFIGENMMITAVLMKQAWSSSESKGYITNNDQKSKDHRPEKGLPSGTRRTLPHRWHGSRSMSAV